MTSNPGSPADTVSLRSGRTMPVLGLGTWQLTDDTAGTVQSALDMGYRMIDTSGDYGSQPGIAQALHRSEVPRGDLYLVTKVEEDEDAYEATKDRLRELELERADLMLVHRPPAAGAGVDLWRGLQQARDDGLAVDIGVSNYTIEEIDALVEATGEVPAVNQIEWSPFGWSRTMLDYCNAHGIVLQAYSPLTRRKRLADDVLGEIAGRHGKTPAQTLIRWGLQLGVVPLPKANDLGHLRENIGVFDFELSADDMDRLEQCNEHYSSLGGSLAYT
jgi:diketogulonate reductase-like aldo/keto reductase